MVKESRVPAIGSKLGENSLSASASADLALAPVLDMRVAREFKRSLEVLYARGSPCVIDAHDVARISTGCIQVFAAFVVAMTGIKKRVTLRRASPAMLGSFEQLGLSQFITLCTLES